MGIRRRTVEEIITKLREAEVRLAQGETVGQVCRQLGVSEQTFYRWRREYGGLRMDQAGLVPAQLLHRGLPGGRNADHGVPEALQPDPQIQRGKRLVLHHHDLRPRPSCDNHRRSPPGSMGHLTSVDGSGSEARCNPCVGHNT